MADSDRERALESALANIEKQFGKGAVMRLGDDTAQQVPAIPTGALTLDVALGVGGLPRGRVVELYGPESSGKTTLALHVLAEAQKQGGIAAFIDAEHALDPTYAGAIGLDIDELLVAQPDTGEQALEIMDMLIRSGAVDVIAVDSVAALTPRAEIEGEMGDSHVGLQARLMSQAMRKLAGSLKKSSTCAIFINQIREKIGVMFGSPETTPGGRALKFYSSVRLDIRRIETLKDGKDAVGNRCRVKVVKNKCLAAGTRVFDPTTGLTHAIEDVVEEGVGTSVWATDKRGRLEIRPIGARLDQGEQEVIGLRLGDGTELTVTPDHRIMTEEGWREAGELGVGDRVARPRRAGSFGDQQPIPPAHARRLGCLVGDGRPAPGGRIPGELFAPEVSREVLANLLSGLWETAGWISREPTGGVRLGLTTTSEQLAWQLHWLLLRFGVVSTVRAHEPGSRRSLVEGRRIQGSRPGWQVRVSGTDDVHRFAAEVPTWGPKGRRLVETLDEPASAGRRRSRAVHLPASVTEPVRSYLADRGISARDAAGMIGEPAGDPRGGMAQVLGAIRIRRDRLAVLADALDSGFLRDVLAEEVYYERIREVTAPRTERTYDLEVPELHNLVADGVVVHNCAPPFRLAEFDIVYGEGISKEGTLLDLGVEEGLIRKAGAWYSYDDEQLGQGRENARQFLREHDDVAREIEKRIKEELGIAPLAGDADEADEAAGDDGEE